MVWSLTPRCTTALILIGSETDVGGGLDGVQDTAGAEAAAVHQLEDFVVDAVETDRDAVQARVLELLRLLGQQIAIGGEGDVRDALDVGHLGDELPQVGSQQGLAAGDAGLVYAELSEQTGDAGDLLEGQDFLTRQELVGLAEDLGGHAIRAAEVAAVGDRDSQVSHGPAHCVDYVRKHGFPFDF